MKKLLIVIGFIVILLLPAVTLSCAASNVAASLGEEFTLKVGQTANVIDEDLTINFEAVTSDSRCPTGAQCIWEGEATCNMVITYQGAETEVVFTQPGSSTGQVTFQQYTFSFQLKPYPQVDQQIDDCDYYLDLTVSK
ncbi:MAG: hypothetical protein PHG35_07730 [Dehalococcoidales bacterium]|nr:hypothetical protein [Dehalococcoidales bacterium]